ncbi:hypothetical protein NMY22_g17269 [Coprinellus aureogranulatus]|nr:hypothetical protein NMY22_g17269 [Coprinellus aureogranulatus]
MPKASRATTKRGKTSSGPQKHMESFESENIAPNVAAFQEEDHKPRGHPPKKEETLTISALQGKKFRRMERRVSEWKRKVRSIQEELGDRDARLLALAAENETLKEELEEVNRTTYERIYVFRQQLLDAGIEPEEEMGLEEVDGSQYPPWKAPL